MRAPLMVHVDFMQGPMSVVELFPRMKWTQYLKKIRAETRNVQDKKQPEFEGCEHNYWFGNV